MQQQFLQSISIHALCAGSDIWTTSTRRTMPHFNPRSPCGERRCRACHRTPLRSRFNPRSPCGERHLGVLDEGSIDECFNPRSPCGERRPHAQGQYQCVGVSTHAPLAGSDYPIVALQPIDDVSTHAPLAGSDTGRKTWGAAEQVSTHAPLAGSDPLQLQAVFGRCEVSTHAPLAGSDSATIGYGTTRTGFNPRSPCGERR